MLYVRLDKEIETKLNYLSRIKGISKSQIIRDALHNYLENLETPQNPFELEKDLFGVEGQDSHLSLEYKRILKENIQKKIQG
jgi:predicted DNA-binding protein